MRGNLLVALAGDAWSMVSLLHPPDRNSTALAALLDEAPLLVRRTNSSAAADWFNHTWLRYTGRPVADELGAGWQRGLHPDDRASYLLAAASASEKQSEFSFEYRLRRHDGAYRWMLETSKPWRSVDGALAGHVAYCIDLTERREAEAAAREAAARLRTILETEPECVKLLDREGRLLDMNPAGLALIEADSLEAVRGHDVRELVAAEDRAAFTAMIEAVFAGESSTLEFTIEGLRGTRRRLETRSVPLWNDAGHWQVRMLLGVTRDVTEHRRTEAALRESEERYRSTMDAALTGIYVLDDLAFRYVNPMMAAMFGWKPEEIVGSLQFPDLVAPADRERVRGLIARSGGSTRPHEIRFRRRDGSDFDGLLWASASAVEGRGQRVGTVVDITERKRGEARVQRLAYYDTVTGLPNRSLLRERAARTFAAAAQQSSQVAVLFVDIDRFKAVNDSLGHAVGDEALEQVARRIASHVRGSDTVARHGGDEFVVVLASADAEVAGRAAANILAATGGPYHLHGHDVELTTSIGISLYPADGTDFESLIERADSAMYRAKAAGRNAYRFFAPDEWQTPPPAAR